jgi:hypothetical protein
MLIALLGICVLAGCDGGKPIVLQSNSFPAPNGKWVAVVEEVDNGLGFGLGVLYWEVHLLSAGKVVQDRGERSKSSVFYAESTYGKKPDVSVSWVPNDTLQIFYNPAQKPGRLVTKYGAVSIEAQPASGGMRP